MNRPAAPNASDRRAAHRKVLRQAASMIQGDTARQVKTWDLGTDGMCLLTSKPIPPGSKWQVTFDIPRPGQATTVTVHVKVVYSSYAGPNEFKVGAIITDLDQEVVNTIQEFAMTS